MTPNDYYQWWQHAVAAFPALHRLFPEKSEEARRRSKAWQSALGNLSLEAAKQAIDAMLAGKADPPRYDWAELPAKVLAYCGEQANAELARSFRDYHEDGPRHRCQHCRDSISGLVAIWNPFFIEACDQEIVAAENTRQVQDIFRAWRDKDRHANRYRTFAVVCCCESPAARRKRDKAAEEKRSSAVFNPRRHSVFGPLAQLREHLNDASRYEWEYSNGQA